MGSNWMSYFLLIVILYSCDTNEEPRVSNKNEDSQYKEQTSTVKAHQNDEVEDEESPEPKTLVVENFNLGAYTFKIYKGDVPDGLFFEDTEGVYTRSKELLLIDSYEDVFRNADTLSFIIDDGDKLHLSDHEIDPESSNHEDLRNYYFQGDLSGLDYWKVFFIAHEYTGSILLHQKTGEKLYTLNNYIHGADSAFVLFYNDDLEARFEENGFHLMKTHHQKLLDEGMKEFDTWGPKSIVYHKESKKYFIQAMVRDGYTTELDTFTMDVVPHAAGIDL